MIHGAKLLNKNKICKVLRVKNKKNQKKKLQKKIENTQRWRSGLLIRGGRAQKKSSNFIKTKNKTHTQRTFHTCFNCYKGAKVQR